MTSKTSKRLRRFFSSSPFQHAGDQVILSPAESRHMKTILRMEASDRCFLIDGAGHEAMAYLQEYRPGGEAVLKIETVMDRTGGFFSMVLNFYVAIPQRGKMDSMIEKAQEWSADRVQPIETERTIVKMAEAQKSKVAARWEKIAREAAKQSGSLRLTEISEPIAFSAALESVSPGAHLVIFHPGEGGIDFGDWVRSLTERFGSHFEGPSRTGRRYGGDFHLFFGPEGGFSEAEVRAAESRGAVRIKLGQTILKVDTAFLGVLSALRLLFL